MGYYCYYLKTTASQHWLEKVAVVMHCNLRWTKLQQIWGEHRSIIAAPNLIYFQNEDESKTSVGNQGLILPFFTPPPVKI